MDKNLHDDIDNFFLDRLKNYAEKPAENLWSEIDKRLTEKEIAKPIFKKLTILSAAGVIILCLLAPLFLSDPFSNERGLPEERSINKKSNKYTQANSSATTDAPVHITTIKDNNTGTTAQNNQNSTSLSKLLDQDFTIEQIHSLRYNSNVLNTEKKLQQPGSLNELNLSDDDLVIKNKANATKAQSTIIRLSKQHNITISPFYSFDHISGRFIEQYEFDNTNKNDYQKREKPDMSFTAGVLVKYMLNKKISIMPGVSVSNANLSISTTAVNALKDENGIYKFKLATSYGLAEISQSGITPAEGDSLIVSSATLRLQYISFPVLINYDFNSKKIKLSAHGGIAVNKIMSDKVEAEYKVQSNDELETVNKIEGMRRIFFTVNAGVEVGYPVNQKIDVSVSPELRYGINSINKSTPVKTYPVNYGLAFKLNFKL